MVSFELSKEMEKDVFPLVKNMGQRKNSEFPIEESNLRPSDSAIQCSTTEPQRLCGDEVYYKVHMTHILHTAGISNVNSIIFVNIIRKMVSFSSWGIKIFFLCPTLMTTSFSILKVLLPVLVRLL